MLITGNYIALLEATTELKPNCSVVASLFMSAQQITARLNAPLSFVTFTVD